LGIVALTCLNGDPEGRGMGVHSRSLQVVPPPWREVLRSGRRWVVVTVIGFVALAGAALVIRDSAAEDAVWANDLSPVRADIVSIDREPFYLPGRGRGTTVVLGKATLGFAVDGAEVRVPVYFEHGDAFAGGRTLGIWVNPDKPAEYATTLYGRTPYLARNYYLAEVLLVLGGLITIVGIGALAIVRKDLSTWKSVPERATRAARRSWRSPHRR